MNRYGLVMENGPESKIIQKYLCRVGTVWYGIVLACSVRFGPVQVWFDSVWIRFGSDNVVMGEGRFSP